MQFLKDFSISAVIAGFVTVLVGYSSAAVIVFQAAQALGAPPAEVGSWMWALELSMGVTCIGLSLRYRAPVATAWSTPGAAMLVTAAAGVSMPEAIAGFLISAGLITLCGFTGWFERTTRRIPLSLAAGMLAGVLLQFGLDVFVAMQARFVMTAAMFGMYFWQTRLSVRRPSSLFGSPHRGSA
ncbi:MAG: benzoate/H(+) symporter BenE family transporter [Leptolyngbyaceae cyanobacterium T60_A2020_046]|nr:benzoate/H(+) symporter BenE family transporter [Leptolyngbyaceae cyanobacterium T60_A2020_046]